MIYGLSNVSLCHKTRNFSMGLDHAEKYWETWVRNNGLCFSFPFLLTDGTYAICEFIGARNERFPVRMALWQNYLFRRADIVSYAVVDEITERVNMELSKVNKIKR